MPPIVPVTVTETGKAATDPEPDTVNPVMYVVLPEAAAKVAAAVAAATLPEEADRGVAPEGNAPDPTPESVPEPSVKVTYRLPSGAV